MEKKATHQVRISYNTFHKKSITVECNGYHHRKWNQ